MNVSVVGYRNLIEPPVHGDCQDTECKTIVNPFFAPEAYDDVRDRPLGQSLDDAIALHRGRGVLLVARYSGGTTGPLRDRIAVSVCAPCDERRLRAWLEDES